MSQYENILLEIDPEGRVAVLTVNRADKLNALNRSLLLELEAALEAIAGDDNVRALVITGAGNRAFVAGADIGEVAALSSAEEAEEFSRFGQRVFSKIEQLTVPVIMAVNGYALGGGCELALSGDIRLAAGAFHFVECLELRGTRIQFRLHRCPVDPRMTKHVFCEPVFESHDQLG